MKTFNTIEELHAEWEVNDSCNEGVEFNKSCETIQEVLEKCPLDFRIWRLKEGYIQFAEHCPWDELDDWEWSYLLSHQPQFAERRSCGKL